MKNYSQSTEQQVILNYFNGFKGTFCDIGANDGITFSNTYALALSGWRGLHVEASPKAFEKLVRATAKFENTVAANVALGNRNGKMILNESGPLVTSDDVALVSTFHQHEMDRFRKSVRYTPIEVEVCTWQELIKDYPHTFDFISMDIEGSELEVLPQMDLSEVKCFCIEWNGNHKLMIEYEKYLTGFRLIHNTPENLIYAR